MIQTNNHTNTSSISSQQADESEYYNKEYGMGKKELLFIYHSFSENPEAAEEILRDLFEDYTLIVDTITLKQVPDSGDVPEWVEFSGLDGYGKSFVGFMRIVQNSTTLNDLTVIFQKDIDRVLSEREGRLPRILEFVASDADKVNDGKNYHKVEISLTNPSLGVVRLCEVVYLSRNKITKKII